MNAVAWVLGIGIFTGLLLAFPKRMGLLIVILVILATVITGAIYGYEAFTSYQREHEVSKIKVFVQHDPDRCSAEYPLLIGLVNRTDNTIIKTRFSISGFREGHSEAIYETGYNDYSTDRIIPPGEGSWACWRIPERAYNTSDDLIKRHLPENLVWTVTDVRPVFKNR